MTQIFFNKFIDTKLKTLILEFLKDFKLEEIQNPLTNPKSLTIIPIVYEKNFGELPSFKSLQDMDLSSDLKELETFNVEQQQVLREFFRIKNIFFKRKVIILFVSTDEQNVDDFILEFVFQAPVGLLYFDPQFKVSREKTDLHIVTKYKLRRYIENPYLVLPFGTKQEKKETEEVAETQYEEEEKEDDTEEERKRKFSIFKDLVIIFYKNPTEKNYFKILKQYAKNGLIDKKTKYIFTMATKYISGLLLVRLNKSYAVSITDFIYTLNEIQIFKMFYSKLLTKYQGNEKILDSLDLIKEKYRIPEEYLEKEYGL
jgi:hypothetical protein